MVVTVDVAVVLAVLAADDEPVLVAVEDAVLVTVVDGDVCAHGKYVPPWNALIAPLRSCVLSQTDPDTSVSRPSVLHEKDPVSRDLFW